MAPISGVMLLVAAPARRRRGLDSAACATAQQSKSTSSAGGFMPINRGRRMPSLETAGDAGIDQRSVEGPVAQPRRVVRIALLRSIEHIRDFAKKVHARADLPAEPDVHDRARVLVDIERRRRRGVGQYIFADVAYQHPRAEGTVLVGDVDIRRLRDKTDDVTGRAIRRAAVV